VEGENCRKQGEYFYSQLVALKEKHSSILRVKGRGLILGIELSFKGADIASECMERGFLINCTMDSILRFIPPLIITEKEIDVLIATLDELLKKRGF